MGPEDQIDKVWPDLQEAAQKTLGKHPENAAAIGFAMLYLAVKFIEHSMGKEQTAMALYRAADEMVSEKGPE